MNSKILQGTMPNGEVVVFQDNFIEPKGNCGFIALGVDRNVLTKKLLGFSEDISVRKKLSEEIKGALMTEEFMPPLSIAEEYYSLQESESEKTTQLNQLITQIKNKYPVTKDFKKDDLISWLKNQPECSEDFGNISRLNLEAYQADVALQLYCQKKEIFEAYVQELNGKLWLGYDSALLYAEKENISFYIWAKESDSSSKLELKKYYDAGELARNVIHALHTDGFTHFNLLSAPDISRELAPVDVKRDHGDINIKIDEKVFTNPGHLTSVTIKVSGYKNLPASEMPFWENIPMFSVITGKNGTGKTALLEAILYAMDRHGSHGQIVLGSNGKLEALSFQNTTSISSLRPSVETDNKRNFAEEANNDFEQLKKYSACKQFNLRYETVLTEDKKRSYDDMIEKASKVAIQKDNYSQQLYEYELKKQFDRLTAGHISDYSNISVVAKRILEAIFNQIHPNPISQEDKRSCLQKTLFEINGYLKGSRFKYLFSEKCFNWKKNGGEFDALELTYEESKSSKNESLNFIKKSTISPGQLSSGERLEFLLLLWRFEKRAPFKNTVLLMDEPDAHLHPSLAKELIDIIKTKVVHEWGIQVIMTTHSPTTVSLVPKDCLWVLQNDPPEYYPHIRRAESKKETIQLLTSEFVCVNEPFRLVFVEALDDKKFYQTVSNRLISLNSIHPNEQILFMAHSKDKKNSSCDLVRSIVENCVEDTGDEDKSLREHIFGIVDGDNKEKPASPNIFSLERYSIENYIYDPIYLFFSVKAKSPKSIEEIESRIRGELKLKNLTLPESLDEILEIVDVKKKNEILQAIINELTKCFIPFVEAKIAEPDVVVIEPSGASGDVSNKKLNLTKDDDFKTIKKLLLTNERLKYLFQEGKIIREEKVIDFVGDIQLSYPRFLLEMKGHVLEYLYSRFFAARVGGGKNVVNMYHILDVICKNHMLIPVELAIIFKVLQEPLKHLNEIKASRPESKIIDLKQANKRMEGLQKQVKERDGTIRNLKDKIKKLELENAALKTERKSKEKTQEVIPSKPFETALEKSSGDPVLSEVKSHPIPSVFIQPQQDKKTDEKSDSKEPEASLKVESTQ